MSGDDAIVHEDVCQTLQEDESAFPVGCTQSQAPELVLGYEVQDRGGARRSMFERQQLDAQVFNENDTLTLDNFVCTDDCLVRLDATMFMNAQNDRVWCRRSLSKPDIDENESLTKPCRQQNHGLMIG